MTYVALINGNRLAMHGDPTRPVNVWLHDNDLVNRVTWIEWYIPSRDAFCCAPCIEFKDNEDQLLVSFKLTFSEFIYAITHNIKQGYDPRG